MSAGWPTPVLWLLAGAALAAWYFSHGWSRRLMERARSGRRAAALAAGACRVAIGALALWLLWQALARHLVLETGWRLSMLALLGAASLELVVLLYALERRLLTPRAGRWLLALRVGLIGLVLVILAQPVFAWLQERKIERRVVVLLDVSASMALGDPQARPGEMLERAEVFHPEAVGGRPPVRELQRRVAEFVPEGGAERVLGGAEGVPARLEALEQLAQEITAALEPHRAIPEARQAAETVLTELRPALAAASDAGGASRIAGVVRRLHDELETARAPVDQAWLESLPEAARTAVREAADRSRLDTALAVLHGSGAAAPLLSRLRERYDVTVAGFDEEVRELSPDAVSTATAAGRTTDLTQALEWVQKRVPPESLAGILLLSDGRHHAEKPPEDLARALGFQGSPIRAVALGSEVPPTDAALLDVRSPEAVYLGDRLRVTAGVKADGLRGRQVTVQLRLGEEVVDQQTLEVPEDEHRAEVRLAHSPESGGTLAYSLHLVPQEGELFTENNSWEFETAVTDDRTNVLLVDSHPRWEFRYLRNLFYGRDKSVHLQSVLLNPDEIKGQEPQPPVPASASRPFGEAEATALPASEDEWMRFDVIILGDVQPASFGADQWAMVERAVGERGALLVVIAGPRAMPHAFSGEVARKLLPVEYDGSAGPLWEGPETSFRLALSAEGRTSPIMQQAAGPLENEQFWAGVPELMWRLPVRGVKPGASVLAHARTGSGDAVAHGATAQERLQAFARQRQHEAENALLVTSRYGLGKVGLLLFDQTWRLRYGVGDTHHHRFWGNLIRWGTGENLRAGTEHVRLGTDRLTYAPGEPVRIMSRLTGEDFRPRQQADVTARLFDEGGGQILQVRLQPRPDGNGIHEAVVPPEALPAAAGRLRITLGGDDVERLLAGAPPVETTIRIAPPANSPELGVVTLDRPRLQRLATLSRGGLHSPGDLTGLAEAFGEPSRTLQERRETTLWDNWALLGAALVLLTSEWLIRRRAGVA